MAKVSVPAAMSRFIGSSADTQSGALPSGSFNKQLEFWKRTTSSVDNSESECVVLVALTGVGTKVVPSYSMASPDSRVTEFTSSGVFFTWPGT